MTTTSSTASSTQAFACFCVGGDNCCIKRGQRDHDAEVARKAVRDLVDRYGAALRALGLGPLDCCHPSDQTRLARGHEPWCRDA